MMVDYYENLEKEIAKLESQRKQLELEISNPEISHDVLSEKSLQIGVLLQQIEEKTTRWIELSELI